MIHRVRARHVNIKKITKTSFVLLRKPSIETSKLIKILAACISSHNVLIQSIHELKKKKKNSKSEIIPPVYLYIFFHSVSPIVMSV